MLAWNVSQNVRSILPCHRSLSPSFLPQRLLPGDNTILGNRTTLRGALHANSTIGTLLHSKSSTIWQIFTLLTASSSPQYLAHSQFPEASNHLGEPFVKRLRYIQQKFSDS
jgi:hypothetical protein